MNNQEKQSNQPAGTEYYLCLYPSGDLKWVPLRRCVRFDDPYDGEESILLSDLYEIINCHCVEMVRTCLPGIVMMIDESGVVKDPPQILNVQASNFYNGSVFGDFIHGPVVFFALVPVDDFRGADLFPLTAVQEKMIQAVLDSRIPPKPVL